MARVAAGLQACLCIVLALAAGCTGAPSPDQRTVGATPQLVTRERLEMGSSLQITAWTVDEPGAVGAFEAVFAEFDRLDRMMSVWKEGSEIERLNRNAGVA